jgi:RNA polymerase sigma factor (sigma-70 family)
MRHVAARIVHALPTSAQLRTDGDLLDGFLTHGHEDDFAEVVRRHGPLVWGVCRRALPDPADAEDAFQATFLVLVRRGRKLTGYPTIGPWLHKVAAWTARNVRRRNARRLSKQSVLPDALPAPAADADLALDIDSALLALPDKYRSPIVLCHLLGYSRADAAERLGCPEGTLSAWLSRGLAKLRTKLGGLDPAKPLGVAAVAVPTVLTSSVVRAAVASRVATAAVSVSVSQVVEGVIRMFWVQKATAASAAVVAVFALGVGVGLSGRQAVGVAGGQEKGVLTAPSPPGEDADKEITKLSRKLEVAELAVKAAEQGIERWQKFIDLLVSAGETPERIRDARLALARVQENAVQVDAERKALAEKLDKLKAARQKADAKKPVPVPKDLDLAEIDRQLARSRNELQRHSVLRDSLARQSRALDNEIVALQAELEVLEAARAKRAKPPAAAKPRGHLELRITSAAPSNLIGLREFDAQGNEVLWLTLMDPTQNGEKLARLLSRTKADPAGPAEIRVVVDPRVSLGWAPVAALKACDAAGYKTVKFTGYIPAGGFTRELKPDEKGDVPGYTRHDNVERTAESLVKEFEEGRRRY